MSIKKPIDGAGSSFCSGNDLRNTRSEGAPDGWVVGTLRFWSWTSSLAAASDFMKIWDLLKPVVAKVHGYSPAGGSEPASMCAIVRSRRRTPRYPPMRGMTTPDVPYS